MVRPAYPPAVDLGEITAAEMTENDRKVKASATARAVSRTALQGLAAQGRWIEKPDGGRYWTVRLDANNAIAARIRFTSVDLAGGSVWVCGQGDRGPTEVGPYSGKGVFNDGMFWSDLVPSDFMTLEYAPSDGDLSGALPFEITEVQLFYRIGPRTAVNYPGPSNGLDLSCFKDAMCYSSSSGVTTALGYSVYLLVPNIDTCSGTMMNTKASNTLLLTAGHCLTPGDERSLVVFSHYQTSSCNGPYETNIYNLTHVTGATLVGYSFKSAGNGNVDATVPDFAVLRLSGNVGTATSGWNTALPGSSDLLLSVSHPRNLPASLMQAQLNTTSTNLLTLIPFPNAGRSDHGSSGSGLHDSTGVHLLGLDSSGPNVADTSACSVTNYYANFTKFGVVYNNTKALWEDGWRSLRR